jgi:hypothetical protein
MRPLLAACVLLAGCLGVPQPVDPGPSMGEWSTWAGPLAAHGIGYGYIGIDDEGFGPALPFVAVDPDGKVLWFKASHSLQAPAGSEVRFAAGLEPWRPVIAPLLADGVLFGRPGHALAQVTEVRTGTLPAADWAAARATLEHGLATAREPRDADPNSQAVDGGTEILVAGERSVVLDSYNDDGGGGWAEVRGQMLALREWLDPNHPPA